MGCWRKCSGPITVLKKILCREDCATIDVKKFVAGDVLLHSVSVLMYRLTQAINYRLINRFTS